MCQITKLANLHEGDRFCFAHPKRGVQKPYVVEGQYPINGITTIISEDRIFQKGIEPIAVRNHHNVEICTKGAYHIEHSITVLKPKHSGNNYEGKSDLFLQNDRDEK